MEGEGLWCSEIKIVLECASGRTLTTYQPLWDNWSMRQHFLVRGRSVGRGAVYKRVKTKQKKTVE